MLALSCGCALNNARASLRGDGGDAPDARDADVLTDAPDALDVRDAPDATDVTDALDVTDATDALDATDVTDAADAVEVWDAADAADASEGGCGDGGALCGDACVETATSATNCGACGVTCPVPDRAETAACVGGRCAVGRCHAGYGDCDGSPTNGCETDVGVTLAHCGRCGNACATRANTATTRCASGACGFTCAAGYGDCDGVATNGCEAVFDSSAAHCGGCTRLCATDLSTSANVCRAGVCVPTCVAGWGSCDRNPGNGCETDLTSSPADCGSCGHGCETNPGTPANPCRGGVCSPTCAPTWGNCDGRGDNGCEADFSSNARHCGRCGNACPTGQRCDLGTCRP